MAFATIIRSPKGAPPFADGLGLADGGIGKLKRLPNLAAGGEYGRRLKSRSGRGSRTAGLAFVAAMALTLCLPFNHAVYGLGDEGILLRGGAEMLAGQKLYTEFFEFYPPGGLLITQAWLLVFGHSFAAARALAIASAKAGDANRSGATYRSRSSPAVARSSTAALSPHPRWELTSATRPGATRSSAET